MLTWDPVWLSLVYARFRACAVKSCGCRLQSLCLRISLSWKILLYQTTSNFKRRSVEQLKGTCYVMLSTLLGNPSFHHLTILIPCYLKSHSYIFFCKYFMFRSVLFGFQIFGVGSVLFGCKYREAMKTILPYG